MRDSRQHNRIHLSNLDSSSSESDDERSVRHRGASSAVQAAANSIIRIEMQPKQQIRRRDAAGLQKQGSGEAQILLSREVV